LSRGRERRCERIAVEAASQAFETGPWSLLTQTARGKALRRIAGLIEKHAEQLAQIEVHGNGKLMSEMVAQTRYLPEWFYYCGGLADKLQGTGVPVDRPQHFNYTLRESRTVMAAVPC
jgi:(Z)-2-((N-methylformamido)methylene)-5-hydroxybutyrolactone dehydrogenase